MAEIQICESNYFGYIQKGSILDLFHLGIKKGKAEVFASKMSYSLVDYIGFKVSYNVSLNRSKTCNDFFQRYSSTIVS